jgi:hypothetical protein
MFNDFDKALVKYHSQQFWKRVNEGWEETKVTLSKGNEVDLWHAILAESRSEMSTLLYNRGLYLLCDGYSWNTTFSNSPTLYEYAYKNGRDELSNAHIETYLKPSAKVIYKNDPQKDIKLSIAVDYTETHPYLENPQFFGNIYRHYIIRHATGEELSALSNTVYTTKRAISDFTEEYCYNSKYKKNLDDTPEKDEDIQDEIGTGTISNPVPGNILGADGNFYKTVDIANKKSRAVAIVAYTTSDGTIETDTDYTGLAISIKPINSVKWGVDFNCGLANANSFAQMGQTLNGISCTETLASGCGKEHDHPAAKVCADYEPKVGTEGLQTFTFSNWFLPSVGQWMLACKGFGITWDEQGIKNAGSKEAAQKLLDASQVAYTTYTADAWTSTPYIIDNNVFCFSFNYNHINPSKYISMTLRVVPFIAFKKKE